MSVGYLEPTNTKKKRGDGYVNKRHPMTLSKALGIFGHEQWSSLDKDDDDVNRMEEFKEKLDKIMYQKGQELENKRMIMVKKQIEIEKMEDSTAKKRLQYNSEQMDKEKTLSIAERELHEAYQFVLREYSYRHKEEPQEDEGSSLTPNGSIKKKKTKRAEVVSVYRGKKDFYEQICESLPHEQTKILENLYNPAAH